MKDATQFKALYAYSPYHHVKDGTKYPAMLFLTGANDPRVDPMQSRKMTARLQAAGPDAAVLLRTSASAGHGLDTALSERIEEAVDVTPSSSPSSASPRGYPDPGRSSRSTSRRTVVRPASRITIELSRRDAGCLGDRPWGRRHGQHECPAFEREHADVRNGHDRRLCAGCRG